MKIETRDLTPESWPALEKLFGPNGACAGCWCMWWRLGPGETVTIANGPRMKQRQKSLVRSGASRGVLAFADGAPVGWCAYARRVDLPKLQRSPSLACDGIARALLRHALRSIRLAGGRTAEAYPVQPPATNASAFTGTVPFLESEGFVVVTSRPRGRQRARRSLA